MGEPGISLSLDNFKDRVRTSNVKTFNFFRSDHDGKEEMIVLDKVHESCQGAAMGYRSKGGRGSKLGNITKLGRIKTDYEGVNDVQWTLSYDETRKTYKLCHCGNAKCYCGEEDQIEGEYFHSEDKETVCVCVVKAHGEFFLENQEDFLISVAHSEASSTLMLNSQYPQDDAGEHVAMRQAWYGIRGDAINIQHVAKVVEELVTNDRLPAEVTDDKGLKRKLHDQNINHLNNLFIQGEDDVFGIYRFKVRADKNIQLVTNSEEGLVEGLFESREFDLATLMRIAHSCEPPITNIVTLSCQTLPRDPAPVPVPAPPRPAPVPIAAPPFVPVPDPVPDPCFVPVPAPHFVPVPSPEFTPRTAAKNAEQLLSQRTGAFDRAKTALHKVTQNRQTGLWVSGADVEAVNGVYTKKGTSDFTNNLGMMLWEEKPGSGKPQGWYCGREVGKDWYYHNPKPMLGMPPSKGWEAVGQIARRAPSEVVQVFVDDHIVKEKEAEVNSCEQQMNSAEANLKAAMNRVQRD